MLDGKGELPLMVIVVVSVVGTVLLLLNIVLVSCFWHRKKRKQEEAAAAEHGRKVAAGTAGSDGKRQPGWRPSTNTELMLLWSSYSFNNRGRGSSAIVVLRLLQHSLIALVVDFK